MKNLTAAIFLSCASLPAAAQTISDDADKVKNNLFYLALAQDGREGRANEIQEILNRYTASGDIKFLAPLVLARINDDLPNMLTIEDLYTRTYAANMMFTIIPNYAAVPSLVQSCPTDVFSNNQETYFGVCSKYMTCRAAVQDVSLSRQLGATMFSQNDICNAVISNNSLPTDEQERLLLEADAARLQGSAP